MCLTAYSWPGNVRELENMMERAAVLSGGHQVEREHLPVDILKDESENSFLTPLLEDEVDEDLNSQVAQLEKHLIQKALNKTHDNKVKAAQLLKISERSLWYKIKKYF